MAKAQNALKLECSEQNRANEHKHGAHSQDIQSFQSKDHGDASLVEVTII